MNIGTETIINLIVNGIALPAIIFIVKKVVGIHKSIKGGMKYLQHQHDANVEATSKHLNNNGAYKNEYEEILKKKLDIEETKNKYLKYYRSS